MRWNKTRLNRSFKIFGFKFNIKITKKMEYSNNAKRVKDTIKCWSKKERLVVYIILSL